MPAPPCGPPFPNRQPPISAMLSRTPYEAFPNSEANHTIAVITGTALRFAGGACNVHPNTSAVILQAETAPMRFTTALNAPDANTGFLLEPGDIIELSRAEFEAARFIATTATSGKLQICELK